MYINIRETLDQLELCGNLAALVGDLLLGPAEGLAICAGRAEGNDNLLLELGLVGTVLEGNLLSYCQPT